MRSSTHRILTTHCGCLPRRDELVEMLGAVSRGEAVDADAFAGATRGATGDVVRAQAAAGVDVIYGANNPESAFPPTSPSECPALAAVGPGGATATKTNSRPSNGRGSSN